MEHVSSKCILCSFYTCLMLVSASCCIVTNANPWHTVDVLHTVNYFPVYFLKHFPYPEKRNKEFERNEVSFIMHKVFYLKYFF